MSEFPQEELDDKEESVDEEDRNPNEVNGDFWEANDEPAQGEAGQDSV